MSVVMITLLAVAVRPASATTITVNSSSAVTFLDTGLVDGDFPTTNCLPPIDYPYYCGLPPADFAAARTGTAASVLTSTPFYISSLPHGPGALWIGTNANAGVGTGDTALYAVSFNLSSAPSSASLSLYYAVDNLLGQAHSGIYINGGLLPGTAGLPCGLPCSSSFDQENNFTDAYIAQYLVSGTNWLYFEAVNDGGEAGLIFSADITIGSSTSGAPEPGSVLLLGAGLLAAGGITAFRKQKFG